MAARAVFGKPLDVYNLTGTAKARITVATLTRHDQPNGTSGSPGSHISAIVTVDALTGTWMTSGYQMRLDTTDDSTVSVRHYDPDITIDIGTGTRLPTGNLDAGHTATGEVTFTAPPGDYDFVLSICPAEPQCYDLGLWTTRP